MSSVSSKNKKIVIVFGTGSIACRHSRILSDMGYEVHAATNRSNLVSFDYQNGFSEVIYIDKIRKLDYCFAVICQISSLHKNTYNFIKNINKEILIFCEKPAFYGINSKFILHNMPYLDLNFNSFKNPINFTHKADARLWPSKIPYNQRYMFIKSMGGGVYTTHSHEIDLFSRYKNYNNNNVEIIREKSINDLEGNKIIVESEFNMNDTNFNFSLLSNKPMRFWEFENKIIHFYGDLDNTNKETLFVDSVMVENSYLNMWLNLTKHDFSKQNNIKLDIDIN